MNWRAEYQKREKQMFSPYASLSSENRGRQVWEEECDIRTPFQRDRDRILHSKAFRRLKHKTQVFIAPEHDHYRTRLTHTLEVSQISRTIARALKLNEDLVEAIALAHDLGHTPFGHAGEGALDQLIEGGFKHNLQSLRVVENLEFRHGGKRGLNLTWEVKNGIACHTGGQLPETLEGKIVRIADRIAYINHDIDDALRAGIITSRELPDYSLEKLGRDHSKRIDRMVRDIIRFSWDKNDIQQSEEIEKATNLLRDFLFQEVYIGSAAKKEEVKVFNFIESLFRYYEENMEALPLEYRELEPACGRQRVVADYIAGMSDRYALIQGQNLLLPRPWFPG